MSDHTRKQQEQIGLPKSRAGRLGFLLAVIATVVLTVWIYRRWFLPDHAWSSFPARVVATRVVPAGALENPFGNSLLYRLEVEAEWTENGSRHEAWIPTTKTSRDKAWLGYWASGKDRNCLIRRSPRNPSEQIAFF